MEDKINNYRVAVTSRDLGRLAIDKEWFDWGYDESISQLFKQVVVGVWKL